MIKDASPTSVPCSQKGFNLIEAAIVLGVVGLVIGGIWVGASAVMRQHRVQQTIDGMLSIAERINQIYGKTAVPWTQINPPE